MQDNRPFSQPLSLGDLLDRSFRVYRARFGILALTAAVLLVPVGLITGALTGRYMVSYFDFLDGLTTVPFSGPEAVLEEGILPAAGFAGATLLLAVLGMASNGLVSLAATRHIVNLLQGEPLSFWGGLREALSCFPAYVGMFLARGFVLGVVGLSVFLIIGIVLFAVVALIGGSVALLGGAVPDDIGVVGVIGFVILACSGYIAALIVIFAPIVYLIARWIVAVPSLVSENAGPIEALRSSWRLTARNVWRTVGYTALLSILNLLIITLPVSIIQQVLGILALSNPSVMLAISGALSSVFSVLWQPLYAAAIVLLYYDLRIRQTDHDLLARVQRLETEASDTAIVR